MKAPLPRRETRAARVEASSLEEQAVDVRARVMDATGLSRRGIDDLKRQLLGLRARLTAAEASA